jgi:hypothetical protein
LGWLKCFSAVALVAECVAGCAEVHFFTLKSVCKDVQLSPVEDARIPQFGCAQLADTFGRLLFNKRMAPQLVKKFPAFY